MLVCGIDVGAGNVSAVILQDGDVISYCVVTSGEEGATISRKVVDEALRKTPFGFDDVQYLVATGCGRSSVPFAHRQSTEVVCQAKGALYLLPSVKTVINLGTESSRVIRIGENGKVEAFTKNDKCAAGSGLFLETMSTILEIPVELMGNLSLESNGYEEVSSICAVFAESEVISHIHRGVSRDHILVGLHKAVADRILEILGVANVKSDIMATGGVAKNMAIVKELEQRVGLEITVPPEPQIVGALGAALLGQDKVS
ncbi:MAG TPA: 2-hydroxyglutaryl-CoA dehydratase [Dehalococcoidia bacterium]|nr:2-hydroxyglutaryl-CoA dehydratase [Dehalococcoidia bacterium]